MDNAWRWFFSGILVGAICAGLAVAIINPTQRLGLAVVGSRSPAPGETGTAAAAPATERTFVLIVGEDGKIISQRTELSTTPLAAPGAPAAPSEPTPPPTQPPPTPTLSLGKAVMAKVEQPSFLSARDGVAYVATRALQLKKVDLKGAVSNQSVEGIRDLGGSRIADIDVIADGTLYALVYDGPLEWRLFRRAVSANAWTVAASASSLNWAADVQAISVTDLGAIYLSSTEPAGVFRLESDMTTLRPWIEGLRVLGIDSSGDDARLLYATPLARAPWRRPADQIRAVLSGIYQSWETTYSTCTGADGQPRSAPEMPRDVAVLPQVNGLDPALVVDSNHVIWYQERFGEGVPLFGVPCESGSDALHLNGPRAVAVDNLGNVFISDTGNGRVVVLPKPGATPAPTPKAKAGATVVPPPLTPTPHPPTPLPPSKGAAVISPPLAFVDFGGPDTCPGGRCPEADVMVPKEVTVRAGDSVRFNIRAQSHQVAIYTPGTRIVNISRAFMGGIEGTLGANRILTAPARRVTASPALPFQQGAPTEWDWDTRGLAPGTYVVICTFEPHLDSGMTGLVTIE
ncbi:MAG: hypothetical protein EXR66_06385 [Dehalococcoidia bacterium]|nr:hypothetical protein [Dehalococcoidia bacterium]